MAKLKTKTKTPQPERIDFEAALQAGQDDYLEIDFTSAMTTKKRGRPKKVKTAPATPSIYNNNKYEQPNIDGSNDLIVLKDIKKINDIDIKSKLVRQELTFLEIYFNSPRVKGKDKVTIDKAMITAGYGDYSKTTRYLLARKIVGKYERAMPEVAQIFKTSVSVK